MEKTNYILKSNAVFTCIEEKPFKGGVVVSGNKIAAVEKGDDFAGYIQKDTEVIDLGDRLIMPGFVDGHVHYFDGGVMSSEHMCSIHESTSELEAVEMLKEYRRTHPDEIRIRSIGWFPAEWNDAPLPTRKTLDAAFPDIPVYCIAADVHTFWLNSLALEECGIDDNFIPETGSVGKFENGELNGLLFELGAFAPAMDKVMEFDRETTKSNLKAFMELIAQAGVTTVSDMCGYDYNDKTYEKFSITKELSRSGEMKSRLHAYTKIDGYTDFSEAIRYKNDFWDDKFRVVGVKSWVDGVTSTFTALLLEPYTDKPETCGIDVPIVPRKEMQEYINAANAANLPVRLHCIGDGAVRMALDMFEESIRVNGKHGLRNTIEHIETIHPDDIPRFAQLDVIASLQPQHLPLDANEKIRRLGEERCRWEWPHRTFIDMGVKQAFGTDYPVVDFNPFPTLHAAVTRCDSEDKPTGINPEESITLAEAIKAYTTGSAAIYSREDEIGTLEKGKLADIVVVDRNLFDIPAKEIKDAKVDITIMDGKIVYERER